MNVDRWATVKLGHTNVCHTICVQMGENETEEELVKRVENSIWGAPAIIIGIYPTPWDKKDLRDFIMKSSVMIRDIYQAAYVTLELDNQEIPYEATCGCMEFYSEEKCMYDGHCPNGRLITVPRIHFNTVIGLMTTYK